MDMGVDQARDNICPVEIPLVELRYERPIPTMIPDFTARSPCSQVQEKVSNISAFRYTISAGSVPRAAGISSHRGVFHSHTVISRMTAVSRSPLEVTYTYILYLPGSRCSGIATVVSVPESVAVVPVVSNSCCSNSSSL